EHAPDGDGLVREAPIVRVQLVDAPEFREGVAALELKPRQEQRTQEGFFELNSLLGRYEVSFPREVRLQRAGERELGLLQGEAAAARIVVAELEPLKFVVGGSRRAEHGHDIERQINQTE